MSALAGKMAVITGAGRGIGREHALLFAREGASVVVNDVGGGNDGRGSDAGPAQEVVAEITAAGGTAVANTDDISSWQGAKNLVDQAVSEFGGLDVVINNAGILRDGFIAGLDEQQWDGVIDVHLKGHFAVMRHAAAYWKDRTKAGDRPTAAIDQHRVGVGHHAAQRRSGQLRCRQGSHRRADAGGGRGARGVTASASTRSRRSPARG